MANNINRAASIIAVSATITGCASTQLNYNALDLAGTVDKLVINQIVENIAKFLDQPSAIPAQVAIPSGSVTTTTQAGFNWGLPITKAVTATDQFVRSASPSVTAIGSTVAATSMLTPNASDQWSQNWALSPLLDADQMRRLGALYRYVTHPDEANLCRDYPLIATQGSATKMDGNQMTGMTTRCTRRRYKQIPRKHTRTI